MNSALKTAALTGVFAAVSALVPALARAEEAVPAKAATTAPAAVKKAVTVLGYSEASVNLYSSDDKSAPDFRTGKSTLRVDYSEGMALGRVQIELKGGKGGPSLMADEGPNDAIFVRNANAGIKFPTATEVRFGRYRPNAPKAWGLWSTDTAGNYGSVDGVEIRQPVALAAGKVDLGLSFGNTGKDSGDLRFLSGSVSDNSIYAFAGTNISGVVAQVSYGYMPKFFKKRDATPASVAVTGATGSITPAANKGTQDASNVGVLKVAVGYEMTGLGAGLWLNNGRTSKPKTYTVDNGKKLINGVDIAGSSASNEMAWGLGVNADTTLFGTTGIMTVGDKVSFGGSVEMSSETQPDAAQAAKDALKNAAKTKIVVGGGYSVAGFTTELNVISEMVKNKASAKLTDNKGAPAKSKTSVVLAAYVDF